MRTLITIILFSLPAIATAQGKPQFAASLNIGGAQYNSDVIAAQNTIVSTGFSARLISDHDRFQFGGGMTIQIFDGQIAYNLSPLGNVYEPVTAMYFHPHFLMNMKLLKMKDGYIYTGMDIGGSFSDNVGFSTGTGGYTALLAGYVWYIGSAIDIEISEAIKFINSGNGNNSIFITGGRPGAYNVYSLTTNIGIRLHRR